MTHRVKLALVPNCGTVGMAKSAALASTGATQDSPVNVRTDLLASDGPATLPLHIDDDRFPNILTCGQRLPQVSEGGSAAGGKAFPLVNAKRFQVLANALHGPTLPSSNRLSIPDGNLPFGNAGYHSRVSKKKAVPAKASKRPKGYPLAVTAFLDAAQLHRRARAAEMLAAMGGQNEIMSKTELNQGMVSQLLKSKKAIGETLARHLEFLAEKPYGWLDHELTFEPKPHPKPVFVLTQREMDSLDEAEQKTVLTLREAIQKVLKESRRPTRKVS